MPLRAKLFIGITSALGIFILGREFWHWHSEDLVRFLCYLTIALFASSLKVRLPGIDGTISVNFLFILLGILELSLGETLIIGCSAALVQCIWRARQTPSAAKVAFNVFGMMANAIALGYFTYHRFALVAGRRGAPLVLMASALIYFLANTLPVSVIIALTENKSPRKVWAECYFWSFPFYLVGAAVIGLVGIVNRHAGWQTSLMVLPVIYWVYRSYRLYMEKLEDEKKHVEVEKRHVEDIASLHMRTIEALAMAIDAKDHTTHKHLHRVRTYASEIAKELGLPSKEIDALRAAALLHDIGKLAVPEHIINKPGRLTPEEFEKMKIHPIVGAEILERVAFPYPVAPIVRAHHEKWDGSGYPEGLKGEEIPVGARILAAVDCLDALATDRQYRKALPLDEAMARVVQMSGTAFDPKIVEILRRRYVELEQIAQTQSIGMTTSPGLSTHLRIERGLAPAAGFEHTAGADKASSESDFLSSIASARQEAQTLFEVSQDLGNSLSLGETLSVLSMRLRKVIPYDSIAVFVRRSGLLVPELVSGDNFRVLSSLRVPMGQGLCGWVAENRKPIINGNPQVEPGYVSDAEKSAVLRSAIAVPLEGLSGVVGVLAMYHTERDAFTADHLRILLAISSKVALSVENALKYQQAESSATTDYLTGLPNARSLFVHLAQELSRCRRTNTTLAVMVCDLDGFKQINDLFGHLEGDRLLKTFANDLKEACREYDYVARMGGDEFVVIATGLKPEAAGEKASRLNQLAISAGRKVCGKDLISLSVGTAFCPEDGFDAEQLLAEADRKMYTMKQVHHALAEQNGSLRHGKAHWATVN
ncbi:MAG TPA: HD domain-containing phosphohydrolase [Terriglobales bacterium]|nr:HD domain-containing phosphohydrolase [Terriglobales bacterium]